MNKLTELLYEAMSNRSTHVTTFMRANPPTIGHERVVNQVTDLAKMHDAGHSVVLSHSYDGNKNPLTAEQKLRHAQVAFPGVNVKTSSSDKPTLLHHAADLHSKGVKNLHVVVGQDRVDEFNKLLNTYNGQEGRHGYYNFDKITVHSAGGRDPDAEGIEGVSGTAQRGHAMNNDFENFRVGAPSRMTDAHAMNLMTDVRNSMMNPPVPEKKPAKKKLKEETTTAVTGGLGFNTGNPAVNQEHLANYTAQNANGDTKNDEFHLHMRKHSKEHNRVGFKSFLQSKSNK